MAPNQDTNDTQSKVFHTEEALADLVKDHDAAVLENNVKETLVKKHGLRAAEDKQFYAEKAQEYRAAKDAELDAELTRIQNNFKTSIPELEAKITRKKVMATNGEYLVIEYAKQQGMDQDQARKELQAYASRKVDRFEDDFLPDRYAALTHLPNLKDQARSYAEKVYQEETAARIPKGLKEELDFYKHKSSLHPRALADLYRGSGWALMQQMRGQFKQ